MRQESGIVFTLRDSEHLPGWLSVINQRVNEVRKLFKFKLSETIETNLTYTCM